MHGFMDKLISELLAPDKGGGSGGGSNSGNGAGDSDTNNGGEGGSDDDSDDDEDSEDDEEEETPAPGNDPAKAFRNLLTRFGNNAEDLALHLYRERFKDRGSRRILQDRIKQLESSLPKKGGKFFSASDARNYEAYKAYGTPDQIKQGLDERRTLSERVQQQEREGTLSEVARVTGFNLAPLKRVGSDLDYEVIKEKKEGKDVEVAYVLTTKKVGGKDTVERVPVQDYAQREWDDVYVALTAKEEKRDKSSSRDQRAKPSDQQRQQGDRRMVRQPIGRTSATVQRTERKDNNDRRASSSTLSKYGPNRPQEK